jgi:hypothetical protein
MHLPIARNIIVQPHQRAVARVVANEAPDAIPRDVDTFRNSVAKYTRSGKRGAITAPKANSDD